MSDQANANREPEEGVPVVPAYVERRENCPRYVFAGGIWIVLADTAQTSGNITNKRGTRTHPDQRASRACDGLAGPITRDPFDRLSLALFSVEELRLVTLDRALISHPLAVRPDL